MSATRNNKRAGSSSTPTDDPAFGVDRRADPTKRALLVDAHDLFRESRRALDDHKEGCESRRFDLAVVNLDLFGGGGLGLLEELR